MGDRLKKLEEKRKQLDAQIATLQAREKLRERKATNKRKFLLGALLEAWMAEDSAIKAQAMARLDKFLVRNADRRYFGLNLLPKSATKPRQTP